jgi:DNA repair ATPase RecN
MHRQLRETCRVVKKNLELKLQSARQEVRHLEEEVEIAAQQLREAETRVGRTRCDLRSHGLLPPMIMESVDA